MNAADFLKSEDSSEQSAKDFLLGAQEEEKPAFSPAKEALGILQPFAGGKPGEVSEDKEGDFPDEEKWWHGVVEWITGGHIAFQPDEADIPEVIQAGRSGEPALISTGAEPMSIFEEPTGVPLAAALIGAALPAATASQRLFRAAREGVGWLTGGASEVPAIAKAGAKAAPRVMKGLEAKQLEKSMAPAFGRPLGQVPKRVVVEKAPTGLAAIPARAIESETLKGQFAERFLKGEPIEAKVGADRIRKATERRQAFIERQITPEETAQAQVEKTPIGKEVIDRVKQRVDEAELLTKKGETDEAARVIAQAKEAGAELKTKDGPEIEAAVKAQLDRLEKIKGPPTYVEAVRGAQKEVLGKVGKLTPKAKDPWPGREKPFHNGRRSRRRQRRRSNRPRR